MPFTANVYDSLFAELATRSFTHTFEDASLKMVLERMAVTMDDLCARQDRPTSFPTSRFWMKVHSVVYSQLTVKHITPFETGFDLIPVGGGTFSEGLTRQVDHFAVDMTEPPSIRWRLMNYFNDREKSDMSSDESSALRSLIADLSQCPDSMAFVESSLQRSVFLTESDYGASGDRVAVFQLWPG